ncbi:MAG: hypothetical protein ACYC7E_22290 [Armatimonadota bacterium]
MRIHSLMIASFAGLLLAASLPAWASYSGLLIIPTAETVGAGQFTVYLQVDGQIPDTVADTYLLDTEFGIGDRLEVGVDYDLSAGADPRWLFNAKYLFAEMPGLHAALAAGVTDVGNHLRPTPYVVMSKEHGAFRGHLGLMRIDGENDWFAGLDGAVNDKVTLMADYTSGDENGTSVGFDYALNDSLSISPGVVFPNDGSDTRFTLYLCFYGSHQRPAKEE